MDPEAEIAAFDKIRALAGPDRAVVLVTHRMSGVQHADTIYVLHEGRLEEQGDHHTLMAQGARYASMYRMQADQYDGTGTEDGTGTGTDDGTGTGTGTRTTVRAGARTTPPASGAPLKP
jgi:ATP-binding cassette subfamily B protein